MSRLFILLLFFFTFSACTPKQTVHDDINADYLESLYSEAQEVVYVKVLTVQQMQKIGQPVAGYSVNKISCQVMSNMKGALMKDTIFAYHNFIEGDRVFPASGERVVFLMKSESWDEQELWMAMENADFPYSKETWRKVENIARKRKYH